MINIIVKEVPIEEAVKVNAKIIEFDEPYQKKYFEDRYKGREKLIIAGHTESQPAGYLIGYDKFGDGSFYIWMTGVDPKFRRKGLLKAMMEYVEKWAKEREYEKLKIKTRNNRREMLAYLMKYGFFLTKIEQYPDNKDNRILAEKVL